MKTTATKEVAGLPKDSFLNRFLGVIESREHPPAPSYIGHSRRARHHPFGRYRVDGRIGRASGHERGRPRRESADHNGSAPYSDFAGDELHGFRALGTVLVAMLGIAVAEGSGLISAALRAWCYRRRVACSRWWSFAGVLSHGERRATCW